MLKERIILLMMVLAGWASLSAQSISVTSFKPLPNDLTANMSGTQMKDQNGEVAALIKMVTTQTGFGFEAGAAGIVKTRQELGEVWVYVPHGIKKITIKHPQLGVLRDYFFPCAIEAARTYEMVLATGEVRTVVTQDAGGSFLAISVKPKNASVYIDGELQASDGSGDFMAMLPYGEHQYRVEAGSYMPEAGVVQIGKEKKVLNVTLKSALARLNIAATTEHTAIYVNEKSKGFDKWSGEVPAGMYVIEGRKDGYRPWKTTVSVEKQAEKAVTIQALEPIYGSLSVKYKPIGAEVWLDGKQIGSSPDVFKNVLVGIHSLTIKKTGFMDHTETVKLAEGEVKELAGTLSEKNLQSKRKDNINYSVEIPRQGTSARKYYEKAVIGDADAQYELGIYYDSGSDVKQNYAEAVKWYRMAAEQGYVKAQDRLGYCYEWGHGVEKDRTEAVKWYRMAAEQGDAEARDKLGYCYERGHGVEENEAEAERWYRMAAEQGYANSLNTIFYKYEGKYGFGDKKDKTEALSWFRKMAEQGNVLVQRKLYEWYSKGKVVKKDKAEAIKWLGKLAEQGSALDMKEFGDRYYKGDGVKKDKTEAIKWYLRSAEQGCIGAQDKLGYCYEQGDGVEKNETEAEKWYSKALEGYRKKAEQGDVSAMMILAYRYEQGKGARQDIKKAVKWYRLAERKGSKDAWEALDRLGYPKLAY